MKLDAVFYSKIGFIVLIFFVSVIMSSLPLFMRRLEKKEKFKKFVRFIFVFSQGLASGVLLGSGMLHAIPEASSTISEQFTEWGGTKNENKKEKVDNDPEDNELSLLLDNGHSRQPEETSGSQSWEGEVNNDEEPSAVEAEMLNVFKGEGPMVKKIIGAVFLWIALSIHSICEGLALGSSVEPNKYWVIFAAIASHKWVESYALGVGVERGITKKWVFFTFILLFSIATPLGMTLGLIFSIFDDWSAYIFISNILLAISGGVFLLVSILEFIFDFFSTNQSMLHFFVFVGFLIIGLGIMAVVKVFDH